MCRVRLSVDIGGVCVVVAGALGKQGITVV